MKDYILKYYKQTGCFRVVLICQKTEIISFPVDDKTADNMQKYWDVKCEVIS